MPSRQDPPFERLYIQHPTGSLLDLESTSLRVAREAERKLNARLIRKLCTHLAEVGS